MTHKLAYYFTGFIVIIQISYKNLPIEIYHTLFFAIPSLLTFTCLPCLLTPHFIPNARVLQLQIRSLEISLKKKNLPHICFLVNFVKSSRKSLRSALLDDCALLIFGNVLDVAFRIVALFPLKYLKITRK